MKLCFATSFVFAARPFIEPNGAGAKTEPQAAVTEPPAAAGNNPSHALLRRYSHHSLICVWGGNIADLRKSNKTLEECATICDDDDRCLSFEHYKMHNETYKGAPGDCFPQHVNGSTAQACSDVETGWNLDMYVKKDPKTRYEFHEKQCINHHNILQPEPNNVTLHRCARICDELADCKGFEYFGNHSTDIFKNGVAGNCYPQDTADAELLTDCAQVETGWNLDFYVKTTTTTTTTTTDAATHNTFSLPLENDWIPYGQNDDGLAFAPPRFTTTDDGLCFVHGRVKSGAPGLIATLPDTCRPSATLIFNLNNEDKTNRVDVNKEGGIIFETTRAGDHPEWISLTGIVFATSAATGSGSTTPEVSPLTLENGWADYGVGYGPATLTDRSGLCVLSGLVRHGSARSTITTLPEKCRPSKRTIFNLNHHEDTCRVDVESDGRVYWHAGSNEYGWVSLDGIVLKHTGEDVPLTLENGWVNYPGDEYAPAVFTSMEHQCIVGGLVTGGAVGSTIATLPEACRPRSRLIFNLNNHQHTCRVDLGPDGKIIWVAGGGDHGGWISLNGIEFTTATTKLQTGA